MGSEHKMSPAGLQERAVIASLWVEIDKLLIEDGDNVQYFIRRMQQNLPGLLQMKAADFEPLTRLHVRSAKDLMTTAHLLVPGAFANGAATLSQEVLEQLEDSRSQMLGVLIDLQLFHLQRAAHLVDFSKHLALVSAGTDVHDK